jgi:phosphoadenosine phosphosulfate reductase
MLEKESLALARLAEVSQENLAVSFSGGKDSLVALDLAYRVGVRRAVFADTTIEFDETRDFIKSVEDFYGINVDIVFAPLDFFEMVNYVGVPSRRLRWCCDVFKFAPLAKYASQNDLDGFITGLRRVESNKRFSYSYTDKNPLVPVRQINPILDWTDGDIWEYIKNNNLPVNPLYEHFNRVGCWCCPFRTDDEWMKVKQLYPEKARKFEQVLSDFGRKVGVENLEQFVDKRGWIRWATPLRKVSVGIFSPCQAGRKGQVDLILKGQDQKQIERILKVLPIITENYFVVGNRIRITVEDSDMKRLNVLIEKAVNCRACGACLFLCKTGALQIDKESIYVDRSKCTKCHECIKTHVLRGGCIIRNYSPRRTAIIEDTQRNSSRTLMRTEEL